MGQSESSEQPTAPTLPDDDVDLGVLPRLLGAVVNEHKVIEEGENMLRVSAVGG